MTMNDKPEKTDEEIQAEQELERQLAEGVDPDEDDDDVESLKKKVKTLSFQKEHWKGKAQAKSAEGKPEAKKPEAEKEPEKSGDNLSTMDVLALTRSNIHDDDIKEVVDFAKYKGISVSEALNSPTIKAIIAQNTEFRKTAEVTNTSAGKKTIAKASDQKLQEDLSKGSIPDKGSDDAERLFWARRGGKRS